MQVFHPFHINMFTALKEAKVISIPSMVLVTSLIMILSNNNNNNVLYFIASYWRKNNNTILLCLIEQKYTFVCSA